MGRDDRLVTDLPNHADGKTTEPHHFIHSSDRGASHIELFELLPVRLTLA